MNKKSLKTLFTIQKELDGINHPDSHRIAKDILQYIEELPENDQEKTLEKIILELKANKPWEYIKGVAEFKGYIFKVNSNTLIPRIETEQLVDMVINHIDEKTDYIVDVCSGTGCILISIILELEKKENFLNDEWKNIKFVAIEKDLKALEVLRENVVLHKLQDRVEVIESDLLSNYPYSLNNTIIVTNPPYISLSNYSKLQKSVLDYEPEIALLGGDMGYEITQKLLEDISAKKGKRTTIYLETSSDISDYLYLLSKDIFPTHKVKVIEDIYNLQRFVSIES